MDEREFVVSASPLPARRLVSRRVVAGIAAIGFAVLAGACRSAGSPVEAGVEPVTSELLASIPESQVPVLEDGSVSDAEFERSILNLVACLEAEGLEVVDVDTRPSGWSIVYGSNSEGGVVEDAIYETCYTAHVEYVEAYFMAEHEPSERAREQERAGMVGCLQREGIELPDDAVWSEIQEVASLDAVVWVRCMDEIDSQRTRG